MAGLMALSGCRMDGNLLLWVSQAAEAQLRAITRYDPPGGTSVDDFLHHMLRLGDFAWELRNYWLEQPLHRFLSAAARVQRRLTVT